MTSHRGRSSFGALQKNLGTPQQFDAPRAPALTILLSSPPRTSWRASACSPRRSTTGLTDDVCSASVPADVFPLAAGVLGWARGLDALRVVLGAPENPLNLGRAYDNRRPRLRCAKLRTLSLRADSVRVAYGDVVRFADATFPLHLLLEDVELHGERPADFEKHFSNVQTIDPDNWRCVLRPSICTS
ncbi:hypothetical protein AURDEDRAFT_113677 [Auricularia subglabra TFB-10046 SS5]|nr:hypothetical protein AURDEDRAFT_113677 [Auricularia subglabra TFB-10046 SS5]